MLKKLFNVSEEYLATLIFHASVIEFMELSFGNRAASAWHIILRGCSFFESLSALPETSEYVSQRSLSISLT